MSELYIYDEIGPSDWGLVDDKWVISELAKIPDDENVVVRINSPGGDAFAGISIYNALTRRGNVTVEVDALAASAASIIAMAGDTIRMASNAHMMIHDAWMFAMGNAAEMRKSADLLEKIDGTIAATYSRRVGQDVEAVSALMDDETWFTATEAVEAGFADEISEPLSIAVSWSDGLQFRHAPGDVLRRASTQARQVRKDDAKRNQRVDHVNRLIASTRIARRKLGA